MDSLALSLSHKELGDYTEGHWNFMAFLQFIVYLYLVL